MNSLVCRALIGLSLLLASSAWAESNVDVIVTPVGKTIVGATSGKTDIKVEIVTHEVRIKGSDRENDDIPATACTYSRLPCSLVDNLRIFVGSQSISVQHSVFLDLADINTARIETTKSGYLLRFEGGDASESYIAVIEFDKSRVKSRNVYAGEDGGLLQNTIYHAVTLE